MNIFSLLFILCLTIQISASSYSFELKPIRNNLKMKNESAKNNNKIIKSILKTSTQLNKPVKIKNPNKNNKLLPKKIQLQRGYTRILYSFG
jgi:hypothetical protein